MITYLSAEQVSEHWPAIKYALDRALPPIASDNLDRTSRLLEALLIGELRCWVSFHMNGEQTVVEGMLFTTSVEDTNTGGVNLLIYAIYAYQLVPQESWVDGLRKLARWAREQGYERIVAYTNSARVLELVTRLGGDSSYTLITFNVKELAG